jgi:uncharacterized Zn finger protein (UPF0148 family)
MEIKNCPICGTPLRKTTHNRKFCLNCGIVEENEDYYENKKHENEDYIG